MQHAAVIVRDHVTGHHFVLYLIGRVSHYFTNREVTRVQLNGFLWWSKHDGITHGIVISKSDNLFIRVQPVRKIRKKRVFCHSRIKIAILLFGHVCSCIWSEKCTTSPHISTTYLLWPAWLIFEVRFLVVQMVISYIITSSLLQGSYSLKLLKFYGILWPFLWPFRAQNNIYLMHFSTV